jgi:hypothetical protein
MDPGPARARFAGKAYRRNANLEAADRHSIFHLSRKVAGIRRGLKPGKTGPL